jgi:hypothetical protein
MGIQSDTHARERFRCAVNTDRPDDLDEVCPPHWVDHAPAPGRSFRIRGRRSGQFVGGRPVRRGGSDKPGILTVPGRVPQP